MKFFATRTIVSNRGAPPEQFLDELVSWGRSAPDEIFVPNANVGDVYSSVKPILGPWTDNAYRRAAMLEVMRVLAGFESSWNWREGVDTTNSTSITPETQEAGAWQVSMNALVFGQDLKDLTQKFVGSVSYKDGRHFQDEMKKNHPFAMEFIARLLRHTCKHNGPVLRHEIDHWLSRASALEFQKLIS